MRRSLALTLALLVVAAPAAAGPSDDLARAEALRTDARAALEAGEYDAACAMFAEVHTLAPSPAALLALADCEARAGKADDAAEHTRMASELALAPPPSSVSPPSSLPSSTRGAIESPPRVGLSAPVALTGAVGALGLTVGLLSGALALSAKSDIEASCSGLACDAEGKRAADRGQTFAAVSTVGFVLGAIGIAGVIYFVATDRPARASARAGGVGGWRVTASGLGGTF